MVKIDPLRAADRYRYQNDWYVNTFGSVSLREQPLLPSAARYPFGRDTALQEAAVAARGIAALLQAARDVQASAEAIRVGSGAALNTPTVVSSAPDRVGGRADERAGFGSVQVDVLRIAAAQVNSGASFVGASLTSLQSGTSTIAITSGERTTAVSFEVAATDTHEQALSRMEQAVNEANAGVHARLAADSVGKISLELTASETGTGHAFTLRDVVGNAVRATSSQLVTQEAVDAEYRINGGPPERSASNEIEPGDGSGLQLRLLQPTASAVTVTVRPDEQTTIRQTRQLVADYNRLLGQARAAAEYVIPAVSRRIRFTLPDHALEAVGLTRSPDGMFSLNEHRLADAIRDDHDTVRSVLLDQGGLADQALSFARRLQAAAPEALLDSRRSGLLRYANYASTPALYSQLLPYHGLLLSQLL